VWWVAEEKGKVTEGHTKFALKEKQKNKKRLNSKRKNSRGGGGVSSSSVSIMQELGQSEGKEKTGVEMEREGGNKTRLIGRKRAKNKEGRSAWLGTRRKKEGTRPT